MARSVVIWRSELLPGSETFIANQAAALQRWQPRFAGLTRVESPISPAECVLAGRSRAGRKAFVRRGLSWPLWRLLRDPSVGVVHAHFGPDAALIAPLARRAGVPLVVTFHGYDVTSVQPGSRDAQQLQEVFASAALLICVSEFIATRLRELGAPTAKVVVRPIGVPIAASTLPGADPPDAASSAAPGPASPASPSDAPIRRADEVLFVGRLVEKKGASDLLAAAAQLSERGQQLRVRLIGDGPLRPALAQQAQQLGVEACFEGAQPPQRVAEAMRQAAIFCVPSKTAPDGDAEGFGMVFLEAAAAGLAAVSYASGGVPEAIEDGRSGLLAPEGDVAALTAALGRLLGDRELRERLGAAGAARVRAQFDVAQRTAQLELDYDRVARPPGS